MIAAVIKDHAEIDNREPRQEATGRSLDNSLFDCRNVVLGDGAAKDVIHEFKILAALQWLHLDLTVAILAVTAALLFVAALHVGATTYRLTIRDFWSLEQNFRVITLLQLGDDHFNMLLAGPGDQKFLGLFITEERQHGVLFHQLMEAVGELVFVVAALGFKGKGYGRLWQYHSCEFDRIGFITQRVSGDCIFQLGHCAYVAGMKFGNRNQIL